MDVQRQRGVGLVHGLLLFLLGACSPSPEAPAPSIARTIPLAGPPSPAVEPGSLRAVAIARHNEARTRWGVPTLGWDDALAADARLWSRHLASIERLEHDQSIRGRQGENLFRGTRDAYSLSAMFDGMFVEEAIFAPGLFPDVSTTGDWRDVAHFTQIIWADTTHVGCAVTRGIFDEYLVCRYAPPGNISGQAVGLRPPAPIGSP